MSVRRREKDSRMVPAGRGSRIETAIFDLGGVLLHRYPERAARRFSKLNGLAIEENMEIMDAHPDYMKGEVTPTEFARKYISSMNLNISDKELHTIYTNIFSLNAFSENGIMKSAEGNIFSMKIAFLC